MTRLHNRIGQGRVVSTEVAWGAVWWPANWRDLQPRHREQVSWGDQLAPTRPTPASTVWDRLWKSRGEIWEKFSLERI